MQRTIIPVLLGGLLATAMGLISAHASQPIPIKALSRQPALQHVTMSPNGKYLVGLIPSPTNAQQTALAVWDTDSLASGPAVVQPSGKQGRMQFTRAFALKDGKILAIARQQWTGQLSGCGEGKVVGATKTFVHRVYLTGVKMQHFERAFASHRRRHAANVTQNQRICMQIAGTAAVVDYLPMNPDEVIIKRTGVFNPAGKYFLYNLKTGNVKLLFVGNLHTSPALFAAHTGKVLVKTGLLPAHDNYIKQTFIRDPKTGQFVLQKPLDNDLSNRYVVKVLGRDQATGKYYVLTNQFSNHAQVRLYDAATQKYAPKPLLASKNWNITGLVFGQQPVNFGKVVGYIVGGPYPETFYVAPQLKSIHTALKKAYPGQQVDIESYTNHFTKVLFTTNSMQHPTAFHLLMNKKHVVNLGGKRPWIKPDNIGKERWVTYTARDGMTIPAILDLPADWKKGDAPTKAVILPHGGPWARDYTGWFPSGWVPLLTSRGYIVLRPEYRGSDGLGRKLWLAGDNQWGLKMSNDLADGAAWLVKQGFARQNEIAIFGYSYGGFAAVAADVRPSSPYQCAIAGAPAANLGRIGTSWSQNPLQRILQGHTVGGMDPLQNTAKAHLPIMLFAGTRDVRVPPRYNAEAFYDAVKNIVPAQLHWIPNMPHELPWYPSQRSKVAHLIVNYLAHDCGGVSHS